MNGWLCPRCGCANAPAVLACREECHLQVEQSTSNTGDVIIENIEDLNLQNTQK